MCVCVHCMHAFMYRVHCIIYVNSYCFILTIRVVHWMRPLAYFSICARSVMNRMLLLSTNNPLAYTP
jgi:hypothetical protein